MAEDRDVLIWDTDTKGVTASVLPQAETYMAMLWDHPDTRHIAAAGETADAALIEGCVAALEGLRASDPAYFALLMQDYLNNTLPTGRNL